MRLFVIRHGQTVSNVERRTTGQGETPLTEIGKAQAERIRAVLQSFRFDRVYSSDLSRAVHTQRIALPDAEGIQTPLLREFDTGTLTHKSFDEVSRMLGGRKAMDLPGQYRNFEGESEKDVSDRIREFLTMLEQDPCDNVAAFTHNGAIGVLLQTVLGVQLNRMQVGSKNCAIHVFEFVDGIWKLLAWNYMSEI